MRTLTALLTGAHREHKQEVDMPEDDGDEEEEADEAELPVAVPE